MMKKAPQARDERRARLVERSPVEFLSNGSSAAELKVVGTSVQLHGHMGQGASTIGACWQCPPPKTRSIKAEAG